MSLISDCEEIERLLVSVRRQSLEQQILFFDAINSIVLLHQEYRLAKNYEISDKIRDILKNNGITIVEGTKKFGGYENIPEHMKNMTVDDFWILDKRG